MDAASNNMSSIGLLGWFYCFCLVWLFRLFVMLFVFFLNSPFQWNFRSVFSVQGKSDG